MSEEAYMADLSIAWAHLAAYYYRDKPMQSSTRYVKKKNKTRESILAKKRAQKPESESEEEPVKPPKTSTEPAK